MLLIPTQPFGKPESASLNQCKDSLKWNPFFVVLYRLAASLIFGMLVHRSKPLPTKFGEKLRRLEKQFAML
jgi:hypothetical protein